MSREDDVRRGAQAERLLKDELFIEAFDVLDKYIKQSWEDSPARDKEGRENLWVMQKLLAKVKSHLGQVMASGKIAQDTLVKKLGRTVSSF